MNQSNDKMKKLWQTLSVLMVTVVLVIVLDSLPLGHSKTPITQDKTDTGTASASESVTDTTAEASSLPETTDVIGEELRITTLTFLGECALGSPLGTSAYGSFNALAEENGTAYFFQHLLSITSEDDLTIAANSAIFSPVPGEIETPLCIAPLSNIDILKDGSVELVASLSPYFGDHLADTTHALTAAGIETAENGTVYRFEENGIKIAILFTQVQKNTVLSPQIELMKELTETADYRIACFYGGEEDTHVQEEYIVKAAHAFSDAGASLILGTGNSVLRPMEFYNGTTIVYSLGTLINGAQLFPQNATALLQLQLTLNTDGILSDAISVIPCYVYSETWQPTVMEDGEDKDTVLQFLAGDTPLPISTSVE